MTWLRGRPEGRVWALVLCDYSYQPVSDAPAVMQFEPRRDEWISRDFHYPSSQCSYSPLPYHERFDEKTHLFYPEPHAVLECPMCTDPMWLSLTGDRLCYWLLRHQPPGTYGDLTAEEARRDMRGGEPW